jgi:GxxExxY protein
VTENEIAHLVVDSAYRVHTALGPGLLESVYEAILSVELSTRDMPHVRQQPVPVVYGALRLSMGFRADLVVDDKVVIEVKSIEQIAPVHKKQLLTYLRLMDKRLGLLINFNVALIKNGIVRVVNGLPE